MKRDMDLVRRILLAMDAYEHGYAPPGFTIAGYDQEVIGHHVWLMEQGKLITAVATTAMGDPSPVAIPLTITWAGHDFLEAVRNDSVWSRVKTELKDRGLSLPFTLLQDLALKILASHIGLPPHQ
jgi:hypothetical protein